MFPALSARRAWPAVRQESAVFAAPFAKYLAIDHATLSQLLRGKRALTARAIMRLGSRLGLDRATIDRYVAHEAYRGREAGLEAAASEVQQLVSDAANIVSDWYHHAILELTHLSTSRRIPAGSLGSWASPPMKSIWR